jgi:hypothetical protein
MTKDKVFRSVGVFAAIIASILVVSRFESDFVNPNDGVKAPVGIWKVEDLKAIAEASNPNKQVAKLVYSENAKVAQVDVLHDDVFQLTFIEVESFSAFTNPTTGERFILAHDSDLFARWDDIYLNGANGFLAGTDRDTQQKVVFPVTVFSPDFDTTSSQIVYSIRNQMENTVSTDIRKQIPKDFVSKQLQLFTSLDLVNATLIIDPVELPEF